MIHSASGGLPWSVFLLEKEGACAALLRLSQFVGGYAGLRCL